MVGAVVSYRYTQDQPEARKFWKILTEMSEEEAPQYKYVRHRARRNL